MNLNKLSNKHKNKIGVAIIVVAILSVAFFGGLVGMQMYPSSDYGDIHLYNERTDAEMDSTSTLDVQDGDFITAWLRDDPDTTRKPTNEDFTASLYLDGGALIEYGKDRETYVDSYRWRFDLEQCLEGVHLYYIKLFVNLGGGDFIVGNSFTFQITNDEPPDYDDVEIINSPGDNVSFVIGESPAYVEWTFMYSGLCTGSLTLDGEEVDSQDYEISSVQRVFTYIIDTSIAVDYELIFTVTPDAGNPSVSDTVIVNVGETSTTTTTTTTTDTDTTTTTGVPPPPPPEEEMDYMLIGVIIAAVVIGFALFSGKKKGK
jgi:hypothetical protein